jgi:prepilin-type N-terminal cleavage/methylation domain-containing protein
MQAGMNNLESAARRLTVTRPGLLAFTRQRSRNRSRGFTLLELMIVLSIMMILMAVAVPVYNQSIIQAL